MVSKDPVKPVLKWAGGKSSLIPQLFKHFPKRFNRYFEPFLGGGAVFFSLGFFENSVINDLNTEITGLYEVIRDKPQELMLCLEELGKRYSERFYYELRAERPKSKIRKAARTLFLNKTCFNGLYRQNSRGEFNVPFGKRPKLPKIYEPQNILRLSRKLQETRILNTDFERVIRLAKEGDFIYCDPPYEPISSTSSFNSYTQLGFSKKDQQRLHQVCVEASKRGVKVAISNSSSPFIKKLFSDWKIVPILSRRSINSKGNSRGKIEEVLALSY